VFDLMEEWRPVLLEPTVLALVRLGAVRPDSVTVTTEGPRLSAAASAATIERFRTRLAQSTRGWPMVDRPAPYADRVRDQARRLRSWILGESDTYEPFAWR
jgi:CRISPR-associated protein Cas1